MNQILQQRLRLALSNVDIRVLNYALAGIVILLGLFALYILSLPNAAPRQAEDVRTIYSPPDEHTATGLPLTEISVLGDVLPDDSAKESYVITGERQEAAQNFDVQNFDDWGLECVIVVNGKQECHLFQRILWDDSKTEALLAHVLLVQRDGRSVPRLRLIAPLGTFIPAGVKLKLGEIKDFPVQFQFCITGGCFVNLDLAEDVVAEIKKNSVLQASYQQPDGTTGHVEISLEGFERGLKALGEL